MNILYKYCDQSGSVKILESLELKLPYISDVNDPFECLPIFYCPDDKTAFEERFLLALRRNEIVPLPDFEQRLDEQFEKGEIQKKLIKSHQELQNEWNQSKGCLLSASEKATNAVMWAHYGDKHKGAVIGIDFDNIFPDTKMTSGIKMSPIEYSEQRPKINILADRDVQNKEYLDSLLIKSTEWRYEREFRTLFHVEHLRDFEQKGLACLKDFKGKNTWFLRLDPKSIKEVIFGLYAEESLKLAIRRSTEREELRHVKLYQAEESDMYTLSLISLDFTADR